MREHVRKSSRALRAALTPGYATSRSPMPTVPHPTDLAEPISPLGSQRCRHGHAGQPGARLTCANSSSGGISCCLRTHAAQRDRAMTSYPSRTSQRTAISARRRPATTASAC